MSEQPGRGAFHAGRGPLRWWSTVRTRTSISIRAPRERVMAILLDYTAWHRVFPVTIAGARLLRREGATLHVEVDHRREGRVLNLLRPLGPDVVELLEFKPRYDALFMNRFDEGPEGTRVTVDAEVHVHMPHGLLGPFLGGVVRRALRRYTLEPMRRVAEGAVRGGERGGGA